MGRWPTRSAIPHWPTCWCDSKEPHDGRKAIHSSGRPATRPLSDSTPRWPRSHRAAACGCPQNSTTRSSPRSRRSRTCSPNPDRSILLHRSSTTGSIAGTTTRFDHFSSAPIKEMDMSTQSELPAPRAQSELPAPRAKFFWFLPTNGDSRSIVGASHASSHHTVPANYRAPSRPYLAEVARAADRLGYEGVLTPTGTWCEDAWLTASALLAETERLKFLVAFRPGLVPPTLAAQQTATLQRFSEGRVLLNIVSGGDDLEQRRFGDWLSHDERYDRTGEFLHIVNSVWRQDSVDFEGKYYTVSDAKVSAPPDPAPQIYFGGSSGAALPIAAQYVDVYLTWGEPPQAAAAKIEKVRALAEARGRSVRFGIRLHTISRDTSAAAWAVADELLAELTPDQIAKATELHGKSESEGQRRMTALHGGRVDQLEIYPNLWAGVGLVRGGAGTALVGSHQEVANLIYEYHSLGFDEFILSGYPHLEEAYWFAEGVLPLLKQKGVA